MISVVDVKEIKHKVYRAYFDDGLWDILLGAFVIIVMLPSFLILLTAVVCYFAGYFVIRKVRREVTYPRIGYMKTIGNRKLAIMPFLGIIVFAMASLFGYLMSHINWPGWWSYGYILALPYVSIPIVIVFVAYSFRVKRWYLYAILTLLNIGFTGWFYSASFPWLFPYTSVGVIILVVGIATFIRFRQKYPKMDMEELDEQTQSE